MQTLVSCQINSEHPLCKTALEWNDVYALFTDMLMSGYEETLIRLMSSLVILEDLYELTSEQTLKIWEENPYWQLFSGLHPLQYACPASLEQYAAFRKLAGKQRLLALQGMVPSLQTDGEEASKSDKSFYSPVLQTSNSVDIRRALLPSDPSKVSLDFNQRKTLSRTEPHFDTMKPVLVEPEKGKPLVLKVAPMGEGPFTYQWFTWCQANRKQEAVSNAQLATLVTHVEPKPYFVAFRCLVKNSHCEEGKNSRWFFVRPQGRSS